VTATFSVAAELPAKKFSPVLPSALKPAECAALTVSARFLATVSSWAETPGMTVLISSAMAPIVPPAVIACWLSAQRSVIGSVPWSSSRCAPVTATLRVVNSLTSVEVPT
jgi:hypothetical protein